MGDVRVELADEGDHPESGVPPGGVTQRLLFRVTDGGEFVSFVVSGITYSLLAARQIEGRGLARAFILDYAPALIERWYAMGDLLELPRVDNETVVLDLTETNVPPV